MDITKEEFDEKFRETVDSLIEGMAVSPEVDVRKFYGMACFLENITWFSPVLYGIIEKSKNKD